MMIRYASYFIAALLPLLLFRWFAPASIGEIDFWLLWLLAWYWLRCQLFTLR